MTCPPSLQSSSATVMYFESSVVRSSWLSTTHVRFLDGEPCAVDGRADLMLCKKDSDTVADNAPGRHTATVKMVETLEKPILAVVVSVQNPRFPRGGMLVGFIRPPAVRALSASSFFLSPGPIPPRMLHWPRKRILANTMRKANAGRKICLLAKPPHFPSFPALLQTAFVRQYCGVGKEKRSNHQRINW